MAGIGLWRVLGRQPAVVTRVRHRRKSTSTWCWFAERLALVRTGARLAPAHAHGVDRRRRIAALAAEVRQDELRHAVRALAVQEVSRALEDLEVGAFDRVADRSEGGRWGGDVLGARDEQGRSPDRAEARRHYPHVERPEDVEAPLRAFFDRQLGSG